MADRLVTSNDPRNDSDKHFGSSSLLVSKVANKTESSLKISLITYKALNGLAPASILKKTVKTKN